jgi:hypothetical protein
MAGRAPSGFANGPSTAAGTLEQFLMAGYAVAWMRYRVEVGKNPLYDTRLVEGTREGQIFDRPPAGMPI